MCYDALLDWFACRCHLTAVVDNGHPACMPERVETALVECFDHSSIVLYVSAAPFFPECEDTAFKHPLPRFESMT